MGRSGISFLLAFCMLASMFTGVAFASEPETKKYVSLGDSMTNGYGLEGYDHNSGVADYGTGAYPNQFAENLKKLGYKVDHAQLAMSGIRTEDIHWLLEFDYTSADAIALVDRAIANLNTWDKVSAEWNTTFGCGDFWTVNEICDHSRTNATYFHIVGGDYESYMGCTDHGEYLKAHPDFCADIPDVTVGTVTMGEKVAVIAKYYQVHVADADIISLSVGNGNLGVFGFGRILEVIGFQKGETYLNYNYEDVLRECEPEMKARLMALIDEIKPILAGYLPDPKLEGVVLYIAASLAMNYAGTVDAILQMNPDAEIILVPVMNTFGDNYATVEGQLTIGDLLGLVVDPLNKFIAALPTYMQITNHGVYKNAKFYWADPSEPIECMVDTYTDPLEAGSTVRKRFVESIVGDESDPGMIWEMLAGTVVPVSLAEIESYEAKDEAGKLEYAAGKAEKAMSISMYLAFEKAIVAGKNNPVTLDSVFGLKENLGGNAFGDIMDDFYAQAAIDGAYKLDVVAEFAAAYVNQQADKDMLSAQDIKDLVAGGEKETNVYYGIVEAQADLPVGSVAKIVADTDAGKAVLYAIVAAAMSNTENAVTPEQVAYLVAVGKEDVVKAVAAAKQTVVESINTAKNTIAAYNLISLVNSMCTLLVVPETLAVVLGESDLAGLLALFARCVIGNGIGAHPAKGGHDTLAKAVIDAYGKHTAEDKTDENLKDFEQWPVAKKIISDLTAVGYLNDDQIIAIAEVAYGQYKTTGGIDLFEMIDEIYKTVFFGQELDDTQRLEIISIVYNDLDEYGYVNDSEYKNYLRALEEIVNNENVKKYVSDEEAFTIVEMVYGYAVTGAPSVREIIAYIWKDVLAVTVQPTPKVRLFMMRSGSVPPLSAADKIGLLEDIFEALKNNEVLDAPEVEKVETLYNNLTAVDAEGDQVIPDEVLNDLFDEIVDVIGDPAKDLSDPAVLTGVTTNIADTLLNDERIKPENKVAILEEVSNTLGEFGVEVTIPGLGGSESEYDLSVLIALRDALEAAGYLTKKQQGEIISAVAGVLPAVMAGEELNQEEMVAVAEKVYNIVFNREDLTLWDKITILAITYSVLDEYGYVNFAYAEAYAAADKAGYVDEAVKYIEIAIEAIEEAKNAVADFKVSAKLDGVKDALQKELDATNRTLGEIKALLESDALATKPGAWAEMVALRDDLDNQIAKIKTLADEIGFVAAPYVQKAIDAYNYYTKLLADVAADAYAWVANGVDEFAKEYAELVEEIGKIADELHPDLGKAVRKYLTETPADTLEILFAHGESAVNVLLAKAADASEDIGNIAYALGKVIYEKGDIIGKEIAKSEEVANIKAEIDVAYKDLLKLYDEVSKAPISTDYNAKINGAQKNLGILYGKLFGEIGNIIGYVAGEDYSELLDKAWISLQDLADTTGYAGEYGQWIAGDMQIMAGQLLAAFFENNSEFMQVFVPLFCENMKATNEYLSNLAKEYGDKAWAMYENIRDEVIPGIIATIKEYGDQAWIMIRNQMNTICGIVDDVYENVMNILGELNKKLDELKEAVQDEAKAIADAIEAMLDELKELLSKASGLSQDVLDKINDAIANVQDALDAFRDVINGEFESIGEMLEALDKAKDDLIAALQNLNDVLKSEAKKIYDQINGKINAICDMINCMIDNWEEIADWLLEELVKALPAIDAKLYDFFYNNPDEVIAFFAEYGDEILALLEEYGDEALKVIGGIFYYYGEDIAAAVIGNADDILAYLVESYKEHGDAIWAIIDVYLEALGVYDAIGDQIDAGVEQMREALEAVKAELAAAAEKVDAALRAEINRIINEIDAALAQLEAMKDAAVEDILAQLAELEANIRALLAAIEDQISEQLSIAAEKLAAIYEQINAQINALVDKVKETVEAIKAAIAELEAQLKALDAQLRAEAAVAIEKIEAMLEELKGLLAKMNGLTQDVLGEINEAIADLSNALEVFKQVINGGYESVVEMLDAFNEAKDDLISALRNLNDALKAEAEDVYDQIVGAIDCAKAALDAVCDAFYKALHGDYTVSKDSLYVYVGDADYAEALADLLGLTSGQISSVLTEDADLITLDIGEIGVTDFINAQTAGMLAGVIKADPTLSALLAGNFGPAIKDALAGYGIDLDAEVAELDWSDLLDEDALAVKDALVEKLVAEAVANGLAEVYVLDVGAMLQPVIDEQVGVPGMITVDCVISIPVAELAAEMLDNVLYTYVSFAVGHVEYIEIIRDIAPEAELVILGMEPSDEALSFGIGDYKIDLSEYGDAVAGFVNIHYFANAFANGDKTTFVAENSAEAIYAALNVSYEKEGLWGDANGDGEVNTTDARLVLQHYTSGGQVEIDTTVCDVDGINGINTTDARLILQHYTSGGTTEFPVEL